MTNHKIIIWQCPHCKDIKISNPRQHHQMETCKCDMTGMDLEEYGMRTMGTEVWPKILKEIDLYKIDIFKELAVCAVLQGYAIIIDKTYLDLSTVQVINNIEREILLNLI